VGRRVRGADGRDWVVRRRWEPRLGPETLWGRFGRITTSPLRHRRKLSENADILDAGCLFDELAWVLLAVLVLIVVVVFVIPLLLALVDLVLLLVLAGLGIVGRVVFRRPWTVEARASDGTVLAWQVVGWRASGERSAEIAELVASGVTPPPSS
jgi:hypothetical protein